MATNGMTIDGLNTVSSLTAQDEVPVWDKEASGEHTKKITAQNMAASVKSLASLPNTNEMNAAIAQSTATKVTGTNGTGNNSIEIKNINATGLIILKSANPTANTPSVWMEINISANQLYFYKDTGSGWQTIGHINITP